MHIKLYTLTLILPVAGACDGVLAVISVTVSIGSQWKPLLAHFHLRPNGEADTVEYARRVFWHLRRDWLDAELRR